MNHFGDEFWIHIYSRAKRLDSDIACRQMWRYAETAFIQNGQKTMNKSGARVEPEGIIGRALFAFAAGDAFGVGYEFLGERFEVNRQEIVPRRDSPFFPSEPWPLGGVSDDTLLSQLTIEALNSGKSGDALRQEFLRLLKIAVPELRGLGPTTRMALGLPLREGELTNGRSNGAMMRCAFMGTAFPPASSSARRDILFHLASATHPNEAAQYSALMLSAVFSELYENPSVDLGEVLRQEDREIRQEGFTVEDNWLHHVLDYTPPETGTSLDPLDTLGAVLHVALSADSLPEHFYLACELGGDTDTVAALAGAIGAMRFESESLVAIPWFSQVNWGEVPRLQEYAEMLETRRAENGN